MSRSRKKTPITGITTSESDKWYKRFFHQKLRSRAHNLLKVGDYENAEYDLPYNDWDTPKDGKRYWHKDKIIEMPELVRK